MISSLPFPPRTPAASLLLMSCKTPLPLPPRPNAKCIDASAIRNALNHNHFVDLLSILAPHHQYKPDTSLPHYNPAAAYALRLQTLSSEFRRQVAYHLFSTLPSAYHAFITPGPNAVSSTLDAISNHQPLIHGAVLVDQSLCISARIPFLIRADIATQLFPHHIPPQQARYIAVAIKRRALQKKGCVLHGKCLPRAQPEYWIWNQLLASTLKTHVTHSLIIGLKPNCTQPVALGRLFTSPGCPELNPQTWDIATIPMSDRYAALALDALRWVMNVTDNGEQWLSEASSHPNADHLVLLAQSSTHIRMRPNAKCAPMYDWPWAGAKKSIATQLCDLTLVSGVGQNTVRKAMTRGLPNDYSDERTTAKSLEVDSHFTNLTLQKCKASYHGPSVTPSIIPHNRYNWRALQNYRSNDFQAFAKNDPKLPRVEERSFYIDFELAAPSYLFSEFYSLSGAENEVDEERLLPSRPAQDDTITESLIFMIGCGQIIDSEWRHEVFIADGISRIDESAVVRKWLEHMDRLRPAEFGSPILIAWGPEHQLLKKALKRMVPKDAEAIKDIKHYQLVNMLQVVSSGCLSIRGALNNSVKTVATALEGLGVLGDFDCTPSKNGVQNGAEAMALALDAVEHAKQNGLRTLSDSPNMKLIASYNEADCRDIARILSYLREHH